MPGGFAFHPGLGFSFETQAAVAPDAAGFRPDMRRSHPVSLNQLRLLGACRQIAVEEIERTMRAWFEGDVALHEETGAIQFAVERLRNTLRFRGSAISEETFRIAGETIGRRVQ